EFESEFDDRSGRQSDYRCCGDETSGVADIADFSSKELARAGRDAFSKTCANDPDAASPVTGRSEIVRSGRRFVVWRVEHSYARRIQRQAESPLMIRSSAAEAR